MYLICLFQNVCFIHVHVYVTWNIQQEMYTYSVYIMILYSLISHYMQFS